MNRLQDPVLRDFKRRIHTTVEAVTRDIDKEKQFNTAIARLMELTNALYSFAVEGAEADALRREAVSVLLGCLSPFSPHIAEELWEMLGNADLVSVAPWPVPEEDALARDAVTVVVQINGKVRAKLELPAGLDGSDLETRVMADPTVRERLDGRPVVKTIVVPDKLVNIVVKG